MDQGNTSKNVERDRAAHEQSSDGARDKAEREPHEQSSGGGHRSGSRGSGTSQADDGDQRPAKSTQ